MYKIGFNLLIILQSYHRYITSKSMEISMYMTRIKLLIILQFFHATFKSMDISMYRAGTKSLIFLYLTMPIVNPWRFPCIRLEKNHLYTCNFTMPLLSMDNENLHGNFRV